MFPSPSAKAVNGDANKRTTIRNTENILLFILASF
jgi:hypothetical protein